MRIEELWKRGFNWALLVLSVPVALLLLWWPLKYPDVKPDPVVARVMAEVQKERESPAGVIIDKMGAATQGGHLSYRSYRAALQLLGFTYGPAAPSATAAIEGLQRDCPDIGQLSAMGADDVRRAVVAHGIRGNSWHWGRGAISRVLAIRSASEDDWQAAVRYERLYLTMLVATAEIFGRPISIANPLNLTRFQPDAEQSLALARTYGECADAAPWFPSSYEAVAARTLSIRQDDLQRGSEWPWPALVAASKAPIALLGAASLSEHFEAPGPKAVAQRISSRVWDDMKYDPYFLAAGRTQLGFPGRFPFSREAAFRSQVERIAAREPAIRADLQQAGALLAGVDVVTACDYLYACAPAYSPRVLEKSSPDSGGMFRRVVTHLRLAQAGCAARAFRAANGAWPRNLEEMTPKYYDVQTSAAQLPGDGALARVLSQRVEPYEPFRAGMVELTPARFLQIASVPVYGDDGRRNDCTVVPAGDGKCSVSLVVTQADMDRGADTIIYMSEALARLPLGEQTTAALWLLDPVTKARLGPADDAAVRERLAAMAKWQTAQWQQPAARSVAVKKPTSLLQVEYHTLMPREVYAIEADLPGVPDGQERRTDAGNPVAVYP